MKCVCIICGGGFYPFLIAQECIRRKINFCLIFLNGFYRSDYDWPKVDSIAVNLGEVGVALKFLKKNNVDTIILAGNVSRPQFSNLSLDSVGAKWLAKLGMSAFLGDDALLKSISNLLQEEGLTVVSGTDFLEDVFLENKIYTKRIPSVDEWNDIKIGFIKAKKLGERDIGQAIVIKNGEVIKEEDEKGTEQLINLSFNLKKNSDGGVLVKVSKPQQDLRIDLPTIGVDTIYQLHKNKFSGVAVESGKCIVLNKDEVIAQANTYNLFLVGCDLNFLEKQK